MTNHPKKTSTVHAELIGAGLSNFTKPKVKGQPKSAEHKAKISAALKGKPKGPQSESHKAKIAAKLKGNKNSKGHTMTATQLRNIQPGGGRKTLPDPQ